MKPIAGDGPDQHADTKQRDELGVVADGCRWGQRIERRWTACSPRPSGWIRAGGSSRKRASGLESASHTLSRVQTEMSEIGTEQEMFAGTFGYLHREHRDALYSAAVAARESRRGRSTRGRGELVNRYGVEDFEAAETGALALLLTENDPGAAFAAIAVSKGMREEMAPRRDGNDGHFTAAEPADAPATGPGGQPSMRSMSQVDGRHRAMIEGQLAESDMQPSRTPTRV